MPNSVFEVVHSGSNLVHLVGPQLGCAIWQGVLHDVPRHLPIPAPFHYDWFWRDLSLRLECCLPDWGSQAKDQNGNSEVRELRFHDVNRGVRIHRRLVGSCGAAEAEESRALRM